MATLVSGWHLQLSSKAAPVEELHGVGQLHGGGQLHGAGCCKDGVTDGVRKLMAQKPQKRKGAEARHLGQLLHDNKTSSSRELDLAALT